MYLLLGVALALALFLVLYAAASMLVAAVWKRFRSGGANVLFAVRMFPAAFAATVVVFLAGPAYWALEPLETGEKMGLKLTVVASLAIVGVVISVSRAFHAWMQGRKLTSAWMRDAEPLPLDGVAIRAYRISHDFPVMAIAGILRPRLFIANRLLESMEPEQLAAALAHEAGHLSSRDNLRRLLLLLFPLQRALDADCAAASETAADAYAAQQGSGFALDLASALVQVARMVPAGRTVAFPAGMQLLASDSAGIAGRVHRLIEMSQHEAVPRSSNKRTLALVAAITAGLMAYWTSPMSLHAAHELLEGFVRLMS